MLNVFWWGGGNNNNKGIRWFAWDKLACPKSDGGLGFRDFHMFNMAMVAKQGWNFLTKPQSLVARVFKARYFPNTSFIYSHLGNNSSFVWRSIWKSRQVLMLGCRWRIGDGRSIKIMSEPWLNSGEGRWVDAPQEQEEMANKIMVVRLLELHQEDQLIWDLERDGIYSVKSRYRIIMQERGVSISRQGNEEWGKLWKIHAPPKVKHFLWRLCKECLPTRIRLQSQFVQCPSECLLCLNEPEDDWHTFFTCASNIEAWRVMGLEHILQPRLNQFHSVKSLIFNICAHESQDVAGRMAMMLWALWQNRNQRVWNNTTTHARHVGINAMQAWNEWAVAQGLQHDAQQPLEQAQPTQQPVQHRSDAILQQWQPPNSGYLKCNVDASFYNDPIIAGGGWCVRDYRGQFIIAGTNTTNGRLPIAVGEAIALKEAMHEVIQRGYSYVQFESDSQVVVSAINSSHVGTSDFSLIISHIKSMLLNCPNFEVKFVKRQANMVAHNLARVAISQPSRYVFEYIPRCIELLVMNEMV